MQFIPVKTRILQPPQDDLFAVLDESLTELRERDVLVITSKVVSIHEGRCVLAAGADKNELRVADADVVIKRDYWGTPLTIIHNLFISSSGIDQSNANGYIVRTPEDPFASAHVIYTYLKNRFNLKEFGVIITDSRSHPLRYGATGAAIGWWGIEPLCNHKGHHDLFGREFKIERSNMVDMLAVGAVGVMGETDEQQPLAIVRNVPQLSFTERPTKDDIFTSFSDDLFRVLYERFLS